MLTCNALSLVADRAGYHANLPTWFAVIAFSGIAYAYSIELFFRARHTFRHPKGLYFWSLNVSNVGVIIHTTAFTVKWFSQETSTAYVAGYGAMIAIGWWMMVTGQSLVLYSRLHLLCSNQRKLNAVLAMIIIDGIIFHITTTVLNIGTSVSPLRSWRLGFNIIEKFQMTVFSLQECTISVLYILEARKLLRPRKVIQPIRSKKFIRTLLAINAVLVLLDCVLLSTEYASLYIIESSLKPAIYALKLKMEFPILNQLTLLVAETPNFWRDTLEEDDASTYGGGGDSTLLDDPAMGGPHSRAIASAIPPVPSAIRETFNKQIPELDEPSTKQEATGNQIVATTDIRVNNKRSNKNLDMYRRGDGPGYHYPQPAHKREPRTEKAMLRTSHSSSRSPSESTTLKSEKAEHSRSPGPPAFSKTEPEFTFFPHED